MHIDALTRDDINASLRNGVELLTKITGSPPTCSAVPGWRCNELVLLGKLKFPFVYNSDCRGQSLFRPVVHGKVLPQPQVPVTLPTYDEVIGKNEITAENYNDYMLSLFKPEQLNVLTVHAEVEGISFVFMFDRFLGVAQKRGISFVPLGKLVSDTPLVDPGAIVAQEIPGRDDWVSCQTEASWPRSGGTS
jgi:undecaprenyl phosphate-alpha-L-ara4FN deformylase